MSDPTETPGALAGNSPAASAGERDNSQRSEELAAEKAPSNPALAGNSPAASAGERDNSQRSGELAAEKATGNRALAGNSPAASAGERDNSQRSGELAAEKAPSNTDPLSIIALAGSIAALVLTVFSLMPMLAFCFFPIGALCAATALICSVASLIRTTINRKLEGRQQALFSLGLLSIYSVAVWVLFSILARH